MSAFANPYLIPELIMNPVPEPGEPPKSKVMVHGLPGSKFTRQHAPTDAAFEHIKDGIRNLAQINSPLSSFGFRCWKERLNQRPLRCRQIARIGKLIHPTTILHAFSDRFLVQSMASVYLSSCSAGNQYLSTYFGGLTKPIRGTRIIVLVFGGPLVLSQRIFCAASYE
jgi:hypothetical protein